MSLEGSVRKVLSRAVPASDFYLLVEIDDVYYEGALCLN